MCAGSSGSGGEGALKEADQGKRELIDEGGAGLCQELHVNEVSSPRLAQLHQGPHRVLGSDDFHPALANPLTHLPASLRSARACVLLLLSKTQAYVMQLSTK